MLQRIQRAACKPQFIRFLFVIIIALLLLARFSRTVSAELQLSEASQANRTSKTSPTSSGTTRATSPNVNSPPRLGLFRVRQDDSANIPDFEGTIIDDVSDGFSLQGPDRYWHEETAGYQDHLWWTKNNATGVENKARWNLGIDEPGTYQIAVYIPTQHATTNQARYYVHHQDQITEVTVDQQLNQNTWHTLGSFEFIGDGQEYLELTDETGEPDSRYEVAFDAVGYTQGKPGLEEVIADALWDRVKIWLDDQATELKVHLDEWLERQKGQLLRQLGTALTSWIDEQCTGLGAALLLPLYALIVSRKRKRDR